MKKRILVVGQTPPPYHGQALSTERLLKGDYKEIELYHVRLSFSKRIDEVGNFKIKKIFKLVQTIFSIVLSRFKYSAPFIYYMPACSGTIPFYRDLTILISTRWLFKKTIFHFRSAGINEVYSELNWLEKKFFKWAYDRPNLAIQLSDLNPSDGHFINAKKTVIVPNGIDDHYPAFTGYSTEENKRIKLLYVGSVRKSKGVLDLIKACNYLKGKFDFQLNIVGQFSSINFKKEVTDYLNENRLNDYVHIIGELIGGEKWKIFAKSDLLCFPTFYENESFGNVLLEAMQFKLPVIATRWRATGSIVEDGKNGFLVPVRQPEVLAQKIEFLINNPHERMKMGLMGREKYLKEYSLQKFWSNMENAFRLLD